MGVPEWFMAALRRNTQSGALLEVCTSVALIRSCLTYVTVREKIALVFLFTNCTYCNCKPFFYAYS